MPIVRYTATSLNLSRCCDGIRFRPLLGLTRPPPEPIWNPDGLVARNWVSEYRQFNVIAYKFLTSII